MATNAAVAHRVDQAARLLLAGHGPSKVVGVIADHHQISRRQARRIVARAYQLITDDLEEVGVDRKALTAQLVANLQAAMASALNNGHPSACVGAAKELRELVGLGVQPSCNYPRS